MFVAGNVTTDVYMKVVFPKLPTGEEVMSVSDMKVDFRMSNVRVHLDNLFNGNKVLGEKYLIRTLERDPGRVHINLGESVRYMNHVLHIYTE